jgi:hypothetical protein
MIALWNLLRYVLGVRCVGCLYGMPETHGRRLWWCRGHVERLKKWGTFAENFERGLRDGMAEDPREAPTVKTRRESAEDDYAALLAKDPMAQAMLDGVSRGEIEPPACADGHDYESAWPWHSRELPRPEPKGPQPLPVNMPE